MNKDDTGCEITVFHKAGGPLTKRIWLNPDGSLGNDKTACSMAVGVAGRVPIADVHVLAAVIKQIRPSQALALGALRDGHPDVVNIVVKDKLAGQANTIARTKGEIIYRPNGPRTC